MKNKEEKINNEEISKEVENSIELLILYRSLYIIKQIFSLFKERIYSIYDKYNIYKNNYKFDGDFKIYQIDKKDFVQVTEEVLKDINLIIIKYLNLKDIFLSKVLLEKKIKETIPIIQEILNWLTNNNNGKYSFKNYNKIFFNKKIKPFIQNINEFDIIITESNANADEQKKEAENSDFRQNFSKKAYLKVIEYNRRGHKINEFKSKIEDENEESGEAVIETIGTNKNNENNMMIDKELSLNLNKVNESNNNNIKKTNSIKINNDCLFIESLPLILADFLEANINYAIVESEEELSKELKVLFDNELLKRLNDFNSVFKDKNSILNNITNINISKEDKQKKELDNALEDLQKIKDNIRIYKDILENKKKLNENVDYIEKMIEKLLAKEIWLEHRIKLLYIKDKNNINNTTTTNNLNITNNIGRITGNTGISEISSFGVIDTYKNISNINNNKTLAYNNTSTNKPLNESITNSINTGILNDKSNISIILIFLKKMKLEVN